MTGASVKQAESLLKNFKWDLAQAAEYFFSTGMVSDKKSAISIDEAKVEAEFNKYAGKYQTIIVMGTFFGGPSTH